MGTVLLVSEEEVGFTMDVRTAVKAVRFPEDADAEHHRIVICRDGSRGFTLFAPLTSVWEHFRPIYTSGSALDRLFRGFGISPTTLERPWRLQLRLGLAEEELVQWEAVEPQLELQY